MPDATTTSAKDNACFSASFCHDMYRNCWSKDWLSNSPRATCSWSLLLEPRSRLKSARNSRFRIMVKITSAGQVTMAEPEGKGLFLRFGWPFPDMKDPPLSFRLRSTFVIPMVGTFSKILLSKWVKTSGRFSLSLEFTCFAPMIQGFLRHLLLCMIYWTYIPSVRVRRARFRKVAWKWLCSKLREACTKPQPHSSKHLFL